jgi:hypothetical protein
MNKNILSISEITKNPNLCVNFQGNKCMVSTLHDNKVIVVGIGEKGLYKLVDLKTTKTHALVVVENTNVLWHERYGHLSYQYLSVLSKTNMVDGLPSIQECQNVCIGCQMGKQH